MDVLTFALCRAMHAKMAERDVHLNLEVDENGAGTMSIQTGTETEG